jgi:hypothetical protein
MTWSGIEHLHLYSRRVTELTLRLVQAAGITGEALKIAQSWYPVQNEQGEQQGHGCTECNGWLQTPYL